jgi:hypothetical protein
VKLPTPLKSKELAYNLRKQVLEQLKPTFGNAFTAREGDLLREIEASESRKTEANVRLLTNLLEALQLDAEIGRTRALGMEDTPTVREIDSYLNAQLELRNLLLRGHLRLAGLFTTQQQKLSYHRGSNQWKK